MDYPGNGGGKDPNHRSGSDFQTEIFIGYFAHRAKNSSGCHDFCAWLNSVDHFGVLLLPGFLRSDQQKIKGHD